MGSTSAESEPEPGSSLAALAKSARESFAAEAAKVGDAVFGGFIKPDGTAHFVAFSPALQGHTEAVTAGIIPADCLGGFSVGVRDGQVSWFLFRSVLNAPDLYLPRPWQNAIIGALPKVSRYRVLP